MQRKTTLPIWVLIVFAIIALLCSGCGGKTTPEDEILPPDTSSLPSGLHDPIVQELEQVVNTDAAFRQELETALQGQEPDSFWYNHTIEDMYTFFDEWVTALPLPDDVRFHMDAFYDFAGSGKGRELAAKDPLRSWIYEFMLAVGRFMDSPESTEALQAWLTDPGIKMDDYAVPEDGYMSFNDFFTRKLKPGARAIDSPGDSSILTSPADSSLIKITKTLKTDTPLDTKGDTLNLKELLGNDPLSDRFLGGQAVLCMLDTTDYHRFHSPVEGRIVAEQQLAGLYYGMGGGWVENFFEHRRGYFIIDTEEFGQVGMVCVGMFTISSINFIANEGDYVRKGDELGNFAYGGSAILLLFEPDRVNFSVSMDRGPTHVLMGQKIGFSPGN